MMKEYKEVVNNVKNGMDLIEALEGYDTKTLVKIHIQFCLHYGFDSGKADVAYRMLKKAEQEG